MKATNEIWEIWFYVMLNLINREFTHFYALHSFDDVIEKEISSLYFWIVFFNFPFEVKNETVNAKMFHRHSVFEIYLRYVDRKIDYQTNRDIKLDRHADGLGLIYRQIKLSD